MSIISDNLELKYDTITGKNVLNDRSSYQPSNREREVLAQVIDDFRKGDLVQKTPRREFNDLSTLARMQIDQMAFNAYQPNNGQPYPNDLQSSWHSNAMKPVVRNKCVSIAAHATSRLIYPKVFAWNEQDDQDKDAATVMLDLMEWAGEQSDYEKTMLYGVITALWSPASIVYTGFQEAYRQVKRPKEKGGWTTSIEIDDINSGFTDAIVPLDEFYYENFYESNIQKQGFVIWRRVQSWSALCSKYAKYENFKYVRPGMMTIYNDANQAFYNTYDPNMRTDMCEEILYWKRTTDQFVIVVNGIMMTDPDNPNPRNDKLYPFTSFYYETMDEGKCFCGKSLAFKMMQDANIINTLYPMIIDGTYLALMPPLINRSGEVITSDVIMPGAVTTLSNPEGAIEPIQVGQNLTAGLNTLFKAEESINDSSQEPIAAGKQQPGKTTAYEISRLEANASTVLGLFVKMIAKFVKEYGTLRVGDILQYMTIADANAVSGDIVYKTFLIPEKEVSGKQRTRKIKFDDNVNDKPLTEEDGLNLSYQILHEEGGPDSDLQLYKVNPRLFRERKFILRVTPDVIQPKSEELDRMFGLELYDRAIQNPLADQEALYKDLLLGSYDKTRKDVEKYVMKQNNMAQPMGLPQQATQPMQAQTQPAMPKMI